LTPAVSKPIRIEPEAEADIAEAMAWYDEVRAGLADEYFEVIRPAVRALATPGPECRLIQGIATGLGVRRKLVKRFPYMIVFIELPIVIRVLAVAHVKRRPGFWLDRL
jgi:toxin ParE1/3/4